MLWCDYQDKVHFYHAHEDSQVIEALRLTYFPKLDLHFNTNVAGDYFDVFDPTGQKDVYTLHKGNTDHPQKTNINPSRTSYKH